MSIIQKIRALFTGPMVIDRGFKRETICVAANAVRISPEIIEHDCFECDGTGSFLQFYPKPEDFPDGLDCNECKGTGRTFA